jgi:hypothetical protein
MQEAELADKCWSSADMHTRCTDTEKCVGGYGFDYSLP